MNKKVVYYLIGFLAVMFLFGFSKKKRKIDKSYEKIDTSIYAYKCVYEINKKADTFKYSVSYDNSEDSVLTIGHSFLEYGGALSGFLIKCQFIRNKKIIDSLFIIGENLKLKYAFTKFSIRDYIHTEMYFTIPLDTLKFNKHTFFTIDGYDAPATITTYVYRCKNQHTKEELKEIIKLSFPSTYTKNYDLEQAAIIYRDTCDCKLENRIYKEL